MVRTMRLAPAAAAIVALLAMTAIAPRCNGQGSNIPIFAGDVPAQSGIAVSTWGSGVAIPDTDNTFTGMNSLKVTTHGPYQGLRMVFSRPVDLTPAESDPSAYLQFIYMLPDSNATAGFGGPPGTGGMGGYMQQMQRMMQQRGQGGGGMYGAMGRGGGAAADKLDKPKPMDSLRVVLVTTDGKAIEQYIPTDGAHTEREPWKSVAVPVSAITALKSTDGHVKEIRVFGNNPATLYLGEIRVLRDDTPIHVDDLDDQTVAKNDTVTFTASADGGASPLKYDWTVQGIPSRDGGPEEVTSAYKVVGEGRVFKHQFLKSGDYTVTLTVSDMFGVKKSVSKTATIHVTL